MSKRKPRSRRKHRERGIVLLTVLLAVLFTILVLAMLAISLRVVDRNEFIGVGVGCVLAAITIYPWRRKSKDFSINENGIVLNDSGLEMSWKQLVDCRVNRNRVDPAFAGFGTLNARFGVQDIQLNLARSSERLDFYQHAWSKIISNHLPTLDTLLAQVFATEVQKHSSDSVVATGSIGLVRRAKPPLRVYLAMMALIVCIIGGAIFSSKPPIFIGIAMVLVLVMLAMGLLSFLERFRKESKHIGKAGLVISPSRFVLQSTTLSGEMKWSELHGVELKPNGRKPRILRLKLDGVNIDLVEEYQLPLWYLHQKIELFRTKYATSPTIVEPGVSSPKIEQPRKDNNPYRPPSMV